MSVIPGMEVLLSDRIDLLAGKKVGVLCNPTAVDRKLHHIIDLLWGDPRVELTTILGPQHGARGETQDNMIEWQSYVDEVTGLPVYSLYSETRKPTPEMLAEIEVLVFDVQDVGARYYTFIYTMALAMQACREEEIEMVVLDRPNPINGETIEGPVLDPGMSSFVGMYPLPLRHGMTVGELAGYFNQEMAIGCRLSIVPMEGWNRSMYFDETGLPWVLPSPNIPTLDSALVYPGMCLFEGTNLSEGRGTTRPFEISGAPWVRPRQLIRALGKEPLAGVSLRACHTIPTFHKWQDQIVGGVQIHVTDRTLFQPVRTALALLKAYRALDVERFCWKAPPYEYEYENLPFDILCGQARIREQIERDTSLSQIEEEWQPGLEDFRNTRSRYLLYP